MAYVFFSKEGKSGDKNDIFRQSFYNTGAPCSILIGAGNEISTVLKSSRIAKHHAMMEKRIWTHI